MIFYKTNSPIVLGAMKDYDDKCNELSERCKEFAKVFGGIPMYDHSASSFRFAGITFDSINNNPIWTKLDRNNMQRPRSSLPASLKEHSPALKELNELWQKSLDKYGLRGKGGFIDRDPVWRSMGTHWGQIMFSGFSYFEHDGYLYCETNTVLNDQMIEILGSEYNEAKGKLNGN